MAVLTLPDAALPAVRSVYQPIVELDSLQPVGHEALVRGPAGSALEHPSALFAAARRTGRLAELDWACRLAAFAGALQGELSGRLGLFVNVEPEALGSPPPPGSEALFERAVRELPVVMEITERALTADPAGLMASARRARARGWRIAVDDVGADCASLALLPLLRPDVIKLDLRLVQAHTTVDIAEIITAVNAQAERTGALVLAEGIETEEHAELARMMGATLGQGWLFGRPGPLPAPATAGRGSREQRVAARGTAAPHVGVGGAEDVPAFEATPFALVAGNAALRRSTKPLVLAISRQLERQALTLGESGLVLATFQHAHHFTPATARRYAMLAGSTALAAVFGTGIAPQPAAGVRGADLPPRDPVGQEWDVVVVGPHFAAALLALDVGDAGPDEQRRFDYQVTYDRETVLAAATRLLARVPPAPRGVTVDPVEHVPVEAAGPVAGGAGRREGAYAAAPRVGREHARGLTAEQLQAVLTAAGTGAPHGISIADASHPELPLLWVNRGFTELTGYSPEQAQGRNCRFLQGPETDPETVHRLRSQLSIGQSARATMLNYRLDGSPFWNDLQLLPVHDRGGTLTHYVGQQHDVTERVQAQRRADYLAQHDPLTGLANRAQLHQHLAVETGRADRLGTAVALLYIDLDDFKAVNDSLGHTAGDRLLAVVAARLTAARRAGDLLARLGGDEFLLVVAGLREDAHVVALSRARAILGALGSPLTLPGRPHQPVVVGASIGISLYPADAATPEALLHHADQAMYASKRAGRHRATLWRPPSAPDG